MDPELTSCDTHGSQTLEILHALKHDSSFEKEEHPKLHETEVPVVVEEPQARREELEDEEGRDHVLLVNVNKRRDWHFHLI